MARRRSHAVRAATTSVTDDLTLIKGIGRVIAARLRDIGILTFAQLADLTPDEIATRVVGLSAKRIAREKWVKQARNRASKTVPVEAHEGAADREIEQHYATFTVELLLNRDNSVRRTRVTYVQNKIDEAWAGWAEPRLVDFFVRCAKLHVPLPESALLPEAVSPPVPVPSVPTTVRPPCVKLQNGLSGALRVGEIATVPFGSDLPQYKLHANEAFNVRLVLDLTEVKKSPAISLEYTVTIWAKKLGTGARQISGEARGIFIPADQVPCTVEAVINSQGTFRLEALVALTEQGKDSLPRHKLMAMQTSGPLQVF